MEFKKSCKQQNQIISDSSADARPGAQCFNPNPQNVVANQISSQNIMANRQNFLANQMASQNVVANHQNFLANQMASQNIVANQIPSQNVVANQISSQNFLANQISSQNVVANQISSQNVLANHQNFLANQMASQNVVANHQNFLAGEMASQNVVANHQNFLAGEMASQNVVANHQNFLANQMASQNVVANHQNFLDGEMASQNVVANHQNFLANQMASQNVVANHQNFLDGEMASQNVVANHQNFLDGEMASQNVVANHQNFLAGEMASQNVVANHQNFLANQMASQNVVAYHQNVMANPQNVVANHQNFLANQMASQNVVANHQNVVADQMASQNIVANQIPSQNVVANQISSQNFLVNQMASQNVLANYQNFLANQMASQNVVANHQNVVADQMASQNVVANQISSQNFLAEEMASQNVVANHQNFLANQMASQNVVANHQNFLANQMASQNIVANHQNFLANQMASQNVVADQMASQNVVANHQNVVADQMAFQNVVANHQNVVADQMASQNVVANHQNFLANQMSSQNIVANHQNFLANQMASQNVVANHQNVVADQMASQNFLASQMVTQNQNENDSTNSIPINRQISNELKDIMEDINKQNEVENRLSLFYMQLSEICNSITSPFSITLEWTNAVQFSLCQLLNSLLNEKHCLQQDAAYRVGPYCSDGRNAIGFLDNLFTIFQRTLKLLIVLCQSANSHDEIVQNLQAMARKLLIESCLIVVQPPCLLFRIRELANDNSKTNDDNEQMQTLIIRMQKLYDSSKNPSTKKTTNAQGLSNSTNIFDTEIRVLGGSVWINRSTVACVKCELLSFNRSECECENGSKICLQLMQEPFSNLGVAENAFFDKNFIATSKENIILFCTRNDEVIAEVKHLAIRYGNKANCDQNKRKRMAKEMPEKIQSSSKEIANIEKRERDPTKARYFFRFEFEMPIAENEILGIDGNKIKYEVNTLEFACYTAEQETQDQTKMEVFLWRIFNFNYTPEHDPLQIDANLAINALEALLFDSIGCKIDSAIGFKEPGTRNLLTLLKCNDDGQIQVGAFFKKAEAYSDDGKKLEKADSPFFEWFFGLIAMLQLPKDRKLKNTLFHYWKAGKIALLNDRPTTMLWLEKEANQQNGKFPICLRFKKTKKCQLCGDYLKPIWKELRAKWQRYPRNPKADDGCRTYNFGNVLDVKDVQQLLRHFSARDDKKRLDHINAIGVLQKDSTYTRAELEFSLRPPQIKNVDIISGYNAKSYGESED